MRGAGWGASALPRARKSKAQADRDAAGLRRLSSAVNYLQRNYWGMWNGSWSWRSAAHAAAFGILVSASFRIQAEKMRRGLPRERKSA